MLAISFMESVENIYALLYFIWPRLWESGREGSPGLACALGPHRYLGPEMSMPKELPVHRLAGSLEILVGARERVCDHRGARGASLQIDPPSPNRWKHPPATAWRLPKTSTSA